MIELACIVLAAAGAVGNGTAGSAGPDKTFGLQETVCEDLNPADYWNAKELFKVPSYRANPYPESEFPGMKALLVKGKGPDNSEAEFFAYYGHPEGRTPKGGWPGVVLVHGGGGTAYPQYVQRWVKGGFAVIALDWYNRRPAMGLTNVPPTEVSVPRVDLPGGRRQDHIANVANMVLSHSLLRSFPEVNAGRTVYVGLSWGSWYGSCVAAVDDRFKGGCMIYLADRLNGASKDIKSAGFVKGHFHKSVKIPLWWIAFPKDSNGTPHSLNAGWLACPKYDGATIVHDLGHSHSGFNLAAVKRMADYFTGSAKHLPKLSFGRIEGRQAIADVLDPGMGLEKAILWYTTDKDATSLRPAVSRKAKWQSSPAKIVGRRVVADIPADARIVYLSAYEKRYTMCGSSAFLFVTH